MRFAIYFMLIFLLSCGKDDSSNKETEEAQRKADYELIYDKVLTQLTADEEFHSIFKSPQQKLYSNNSLALDALIYMGDIYGFSKADDALYGLHFDQSNNQLVVNHDYEDFYYAEANCKGPIYLNRPLTTYPHIVAVVGASKAGVFCKPSNDILPKN